MRSSFMTLGGGIVLAIVLVYLLMAAISNRGSSHS